MKLHNLYYLIVMMIMTMFVSSCTAESELDKEVPEESARYYVKYEVNAQTAGRQKQPIPLPLHQKTARRASFTK